MAGGKALVAGATGVVGRYLLMHLLERGGWEVVAVSRRAGFCESVDSERMFLDLFVRFRAERIIP
jgi:nucleoside-diphosphate-sugar epimerase